MSTQIVTRQISDGAITAAKIAAGAAIETSKLQEGVDFIKRGGTIAFTADQSMGNNKLTNVANPVAGGDAVNKTYLDTAIANLNNLFSNKDSVRAATTGNVVISNPATSTFDSVSLTVGDRLFVRAQTAPAENGIYIFNGSGVPLTRSTDMDAWNEVVSALFPVEEGSVYGDTIHLVTANQGGTLGTTAITSMQLPTTAGLLITNFVKNEAPSGAFNGSNVTYTLANTPTGGTEEVFLNGILQVSGVDYTISGSTITMAVAPTTGEGIRVHYNK